jgi:hypothetical protein
MGSNQNFANGLSFFAQFSYQNEILKHYIQTVKLPDIQTGVVTVYKGGKLIPVPGNSNDHGTIPISFIIDENFDVYTTLVDLQASYASTMETIDIFEIFIQNNQNKTILKFVFEDIYFSTVAGPTLQTTDDATEIIMDVEMQFQKWYFERML